VNTRRYHGLLIAALPNPLGRTMMLNRLLEWVTLPNGEDHELGGAGPAGLSSFRVEMGLPIWTYETGGIKVEKRLLMPSGQNTVSILYRLLDGPDNLTLHVRPSIQVRPHDASVSSQMPVYTVALTESRCEILPGQSYPPLRMYVHGDGAAFVFEAPQERDVDYELEAARGYDSRGSLWSRGRFDISLQTGHEVALVASTESWEVLLALEPQDMRRYELERRNGLLQRLQISRAAALSSSSPEESTPVARIAKKPALEMDPIDQQLALAADQFVISPVGRTGDAMRARASGEDLRSVIAGYHWFTDWGRDTMISLEGLCLVTGRQRIARFILRTFARYVRQGLIPNLFPEGSHEGLYHTADATLWFFHAVGRYLVYSGDEELLVEMMPLLQGVVRHHIEGTRFGIRVDPQDGLLTQGQDGYQLTWMDAKCGDWVVTPRRGKAVEINALWFNALSLMNEWSDILGKSGQSGELRERAEQARVSFNTRFWCDEKEYLYDVVDGPSIKADVSLRPNQLFAISLPYPVLDQRRWPAVLSHVEQSLLTPYGLRSLAPGSPDYQKTYHGDLRTRDAAYHQGTVWSWLIGPYVDALLRVDPKATDKAREALRGLGEHLTQACIGQICEVFDAEAPYRPRGCVAQAWGVAELLRARSLIARPPVGH